MCCSRAHDNFNQWLFHFIVQLIFYLDIEKMIYKQKVAEH